MAINLVVEAEIVELLTDKPSVNDRFLVDIYKRLVLVYLHGSRRLYP